MQTEGSDWMGFPLENDLPTVIGSLHRHLPITPLFIFLIFIFIFMHPYLDPLGQTPLDFLKGQCFNTLKNKKITVPWNGAGGS